MLDHPMIVAGEFSPEQRQRILAQQWQHLLHIKMVLTSEHEQSKVASLVTRLHEVIIALSDVLDLSSVFVFLTSRDALLTYLQKVSLELALVRDQLTTKGKTRLYYTSLFRAQCYLNKALEQRRETLERQETDWKLHFVARGQREEEGQRVIASVQQGRSLQSELYQSVDILRSLTAFFREEDEIWSDQCLHCIYMLRGIQSLLCDLCSFLEIVSCSHFALSSEYYQATVTFHYVHEQARTVEAQIGRYRTACRSRSKRSVEMKCSITEQLASILDYIDKGVTIFMVLLDQACFYEKQAQDQEALPHFA